MTQENAQHIEERLLTPDEVERLLQERAEAWERFRAYLRGTEGVWKQAVMDTEPLQRESEETRK